MVPSGLIYYNTEPLLYIGSGYVLWYNTEPIYNYKLEAEAEEQQNNYFTLSMGIVF